MEKKLLEKLYDEYYRELYLYVFSLCRHRTMTEDILQETFLKAFTALKDSHTNMRAWLYLVARNLTYNALRDGKRTELRAETEEGSREDVLGEILRGEQRRELMRAMEMLSDVKREILILQYFGGFRQKEIAVMLHLTPENVRVLSYRAKKELRHYMEVNGYDVS